MATSSFLPLRCATTLAIAGALACVPPQGGFADAAATHPIGGGDSVRLEPVAVPAPTRTQRPVYVCRDASPVIFSDRPCGPVVQRRTVVVDAAAPGRTATTVPATPSAATRPRIRPEPAAEDPEPRDDRCRRLRDQLEKIDDRMRSGYTAREAARLWNRWREAKARLRDQRC
jgi:hypothetical protein